MAYSLSDAVSGLKRRIPWLSAPVVREPLLGLVDGSNTLFHVGSPPLADGSLTVYDQNGVQVTPTSIDLEAGTVILPSAPSLPYTASYTSLVYSDSHLQDLAREGFSLMQRLLPRDYYLVDSGGQTYVSSDSLSVVDPTVDGTTFSASVVQTGFFLDCCSVTLVQAMLVEAAANAISVREERVGGMQIDRSRQPGALQDLLDTLWQRLQESAAAAAEEDDMSDTLLEGQGLWGARSDWNYYMMDWWRGGLQERGVIS